MTDKYNTPQFIDMLDELISDARFESLLHGLDLLRAQNDTRNSKQKLIIFYEELQAELEQARKWSRAWKQLAKHIKDEWDIYMSYFH